MIEKNGYSLNILTNQPSKIVDNGDCFNTSIIKGSNYSLELSNNNSLPVDAYIKIDGKKMGAYRIIPKETITIIRPSRRKKALCFLEKTQEFSQLGLFKNSNKKLGEIEVIYRSGVKYDNDAQNICYKYNRQSYRSEDSEYVSDYMNKYKREKYTILNLICNSANQEEYEKCSPIHINSPTESMVKPDYLQKENEVSNGFTAYGDDITLKYKTYQALDYNSEETKIIINLFIKKYECL